MPSPQGPMTPREWELRMIGAIFLAVFFGALASRLLERVISFLLGKIGL